MGWVAIVIVAALAQYVALGMLVGRARGQYGVKAPAITGHEVFERYFRVQQNTVELLVAFVPAIWLFASYVSATWAAVLGAVYLVGRFVYLRSYVRDPSTRSLGFGLSMLPILMMMIGALIGAVLSLV
jgi:uncharacterized MAPEG superfamily protein